MHHFIGYKESEDELKTVLRIIRPDYECQPLIPTAHLDNGGKSWEKVLTE